MSYRRTREALADVLRGRRAVVLAGAGCSTESGIPDYRGPGSQQRRPVRYQEFIGDAAVRARYWARATVGWSRVVVAQPNAAHNALADLERAGCVVGVITQNVDGLHSRAGSQRVLELHGSLGRVRCLDCGTLESRAGLQERLATLNPELVTQEGAVAPDGDADVAVEAYTSFRVPVCKACGGTLKPDVVFFGENVPKTRIEAAWAMYDEGDALLVVGSSLAVFSGYRFVLRASQEGRPVAIVTIGVTRGDHRADVKIEGRLGDVLPDLAQRLTTARG